MLLLWLLLLLLLLLLWLPIRLRLLRLLHRLFLRGREEVGCVCEVGSVSELVVEAERADGGRDRRGRNRRRRDCSRCRCRCPCLL